MKSLDSHKDSKRHLERLRNVLRKCLEHVPTMDSELTQIDTFYNSLNEQDQDSLNVAAGGNLFSKTTREALKIIENKSKVRYSRSKSNVSWVNMNSRESSSKTDDIIDKLADQISNLVEIVNNNQPSVCAATGTYNQVVERDTEETTNKEHFNCQGSKAHIQPPVVPISIPEPDVPKTQPKPNITYPSRLNDQKLREKVTNQMEKFFQSIHDLHFDISFTDALLLIPKFAFTIKSLLTNKDKLFELAKVPLNENCSAMPLKKLPEKLGDPDKFLIPGIENYFYDPEGGILYLENFLNDDPFQLPLMDLKQAEETKAKSLIEEPPELELKELPFHMEYAFLEDTDKLPKISDIKGIDPRFCTHKILMEEDYKPAVQSQRLVNPKIHDVIKKEVIKLLNNGIIYPVSDSPWVSPIHCVPKKGGMIVVANENNELIPARLVTGWRVCIYYRKLNDATRKDHFPLPFMDEMLERLARNEFYCFLDGFLGYFQILIDPQDQEKRTFTYPYGTFSYRRMPFGLCNAPGTFQRCMIAMFYDMMEQTMEVFMDDFSVFGDSFSSCLSNLDKMLKRYFSKIARPMTHLLEKGTSFVSSKDCIDAFETLKKKLIEPPILVVPDWNLPFELMCDASDFAIGGVMGQRKTKNFQPIHYARKTITEAQIHYTTTEKEMLVVVYAFEKFWSYLVLSKSIVYTDHSALKYLLSKQDANPRENRASWSDKLDDAFWAFRTAFKTPIGCTSYKMVYGKSCHLPIELEHKVYWALKHVNFNLKTTGDHRKLQLNELNELHDHAYENSLIYKERTKKLHDSKIKNHILHVGDQALLFNSHLKIFSGKLKTRWSRPFTITQVFPYGTIELSQPNGPNYFKRDIPSKVVSDLHTIPMDK
uniref:DNA-directed DNA polymerase n=1 Tax=Tanacetum cinerariifolium TaxID=118510 RepID=A0A6L2K8M9_TANCI|nr:DNA-directed DNA polymerase [Tanacetum cinerariifolium]